MELERAEAVRLDARDEIAWVRDRFVIEDPGLIYLDGNSLGRMPRSVPALLEEALRAGWGSRLIGVWESWIDLGKRVGDRLGEVLLGAAPGQVSLSDSTTVNLYKLASAALDARPDRRVIVSSRDNFPTDRYVLEGLAVARGLELRLLDSGPGGVGLEAVASAMGPDVALVSLSHVSYLTGALEDLAGVTAAAHDAGALVLWDLCHSVGAVEIALDGCAVDLAVGCTYKYVNGGPGAPAFLYVRRDLQERLRQPIWGWFGQTDQFAMGPSYDPLPAIDRYLVGSPPVLAMLPIQAGVDVLAEADMGRLRRKSIELTELAVRLWETWLEPRGFALGSPRDPAARGSHVSIGHPEARRICRALIDKACVVPDFRAPDLIRLGLAPAYTRFVDVWDGMDRLRRLVDAGAYREVETAGRMF